MARFTRKSLRSRKSIGRTVETTSPQNFNAWLQVD
jgi:hypothetical protein